MSNGCVIKPSKTPNILTVQSAERKKPFIFEITEDFKNSSLLKIHFWYIKECDDFSGMSNKGVESHLKAVEDFFNFIANYTTSLVTHEGQLQEDVLDVFDEYLKSSGLKPSTIAEKKKYVLRSVKAFKVHYGDYRSADLWTSEIDRLSQVTIGRAIRATKKSSGTMSLSFCSLEEAIKFESEYFKSWVVHSAYSLNKLRESLKKLDYVQELLGELKSSEQNSDFISFAKGKPWRMVTRATTKNGHKQSKIVYVTEYVQKAFKLLEAIINSEDSFLIDCFYHSLDPRFYDNHGIHIRLPELAPLKREKPSEMTDGEWLNHQRKSLKSVLKIFKVTKGKNKGEFAWVAKKGGHAYTFQWPHCFTLSFLFKPTHEERLGLAWLLGWNQITESSFLNSMTIEDVEPIYGEIDIREAVKKKTGSSESVRDIPNEVFPSSSIEYKVFCKYREVLEAGYKLYPFLFQKDEVDKQLLFIDRPLASKLYYTSKSAVIESYALFNIGRFSSSFYLEGQGKRAKEFFEILIKYIDFNDVHNKDRRNRFELMKQRLGLDVSHSDFSKLKLESISPESFRRSAQSHDRRYKVFQKQGDAQKNLNPVIGNELQANKHAHTSAIEHDYFTNSVSPIAVQDLERFANQVSELMFGLAKQIQDEFMIPAEVKFAEELRRTEVVGDYQSLLKIVGKENISEKYEDEKNDLQKHFDELLNEPSYKAFEVVGGQTLGLKDVGKQKNIIVETPVVCALMMIQIDALDKNLHEILNRKVTPHKQNIDSKVTEILASRAYLETIVQFKFSQTTKNKAKEILEKYSLPPIPIV